MAAYLGDLGLSIRGIDLSPAVFTELHRVLTDGGHLLLAFQMGDDVLHFDEAFGHQVSLDFRRLRPDTVTVLLDDAAQASARHEVGRSPVPTVQR